jgi:hypothetical protein
MQDLGFTYSGIGRSTNGQNGQSEKLEEHTTAAPAK